MGFRLFVQWRAEMFLAYIDEVAEPGAFVSKQDRRYNGSPAFGYAGFVIRDDRVRDFSRIFSMYSSDMT